MQGNAYGYQPYAQREYPKQHFRNMNVEDMLKKILADQAQSHAYVRNSQLSTNILEKQFRPFSSAQIHDHEEGYLGTRTQILNRLM